MRMQALADSIKEMMGRIKVLVVDDEYYTRKVIRTLLLAMGCTKIYEAGEGATGLEEIRALTPDVVLLDWEMPGIDGAEFVRRVRSPDSFPLPAVPIIMLTGHGERSRVMEAVRLGVHEFLLKPVSSSALQAPSRATWSSAATITGRSRGSLRHISPMRTATASR
jgi:two-component system, chemotaxis family, chemotaxis protein CheY